MEKEKNKGGGKVIIGILIGLILGIGCGYLYFNIINPVDIKSGETTTSKTEKNDNAVAPKEEIKVYDAYDDVVVTNLEKFMNAENYFCGTAHIYFTNSKITAANIPNDLAYNTISGKYFQDTTTISGDQIKKDVQEAFGKDYVYQGNDALAAGKQCSSHYYDAASNTYPYQTTACGGTCGPNVPIYVVTKATEDNGVLVLDLKVVFKDGEYDYFSDSAKTNRITASYDTAALKNGSKYRFTLKQEDGNYVFVSSEPIQ